LKLAFLIILSVSGVFLVAYLAYISVREYVCLEAIWFGAKSEEDYEDDDLSAWSEISKEERGDNPDPLTVTSLLHGEKRYHDDSTSVLLHDGDVAKPPKETNTLSAS